MAAAALLDDAAERLGRPATRLERRGRVEREVVRAADGADLLICARDGDRAHLGPRSLGPATRFVIDHAPCPVLLVWPGQAPGRRLAAAPAAGPAPAPAPSSRLSRDPDSYGVPFGSPPRVSALSRSG